MIATRASYGHVPRKIQRQNQQHHWCRSSADTSSRMRKKTAPSNAVRSATHSTTLTRDVTNAWSVSTSNLQHTPSGRCQAEDALWDIITNSNQHIRTPTIIYDVDVSYKKHRSYIMVSCVSYITWPYHIPFCVRLQSQISMKQNIM